MDCSTCKENLSFKVDPVPYLAYESAMARNERTIKRFVIALLVVVALWFSTIGIFVLFLNQYDYSSTEYTQDGEGLNIIGDRNGVGFNVTEDDS